MSASLAAEMSLIGRRLQPIRGSVAGLTRPRVEATGGSPISIARRAARRLSLARLTRPRVGATLGDQHEGAGRVSFRFGWVTSLLPGWGGHHGVAAFPLHC